MRLTIAGGLSCLRLQQGIRYTDGIDACLDSYTIFLIVQGDVDFLAVCRDQKPHEETSERVSSVPGKNRARGFQAAAAHTSKSNNHGMEADW